MEGSLIMEVKIGKNEGILKERELSVVIEDHDMWNLDHTLSLVIHPSLLKFKEKLNGHPSHVTLEEWEIILDKMIWSFGQIVNWNEEEPDYLHSKEEYDAYHAKIQEGLDLFGKYFRNLWD